MAGIGWYSQLVVASSLHVRFSLPHWGPPLTPYARCHENIYFLRWLLRWLVGLLVGWLAGWLASNQLIKLFS